MLSLNIFLRLLLGSYFRNWRANCDHSSGIIHVENYLWQNVNKLLYRAQGNYPSSEWLSRAYEFRRGKQNFTKLNEHFAIFIEVLYAQGFDWQLSSQNYHIVVSKGAPNGGWVNQTQPTKGLTYEPSLLFTFCWNLVPVVCRERDFQRWSLRFPSFWLHGGSNSAHVP